MKILLEGLRKFNSEVYPNQRPFFEKLAKGQSPHTLFITCSDSRIDPNLMTQTEPGEIFVIRNAGNIVPPYNASSGGEEAAIEFAIDGLKVKHIVVCGHSHCGAMKALLHDEMTDTLPSVRRWLVHAEATRRRIIANDSTGSLDQTVCENVLVQIENLKTHPSVSAALRKKAINIFGWVYHLETGYVSLYDPMIDRFVSSVEVKARNEIDLMHYSN
jgi:carbonic anhydrase